MKKNFIVCSDVGELLIFKIVQADCRDNAIMIGGVGEQLTFAKEYSSLCSSFAEKNSYTFNHTEIIFPEIIIVLTVTQNGVVKLYTKKSGRCDNKCIHEKDAWINIALNEIFHNENDSIRVVYIGRNISNLEFHPYWYDDNEEEPGVIFVDNSIESWDNTIL